MKMTSFSESRLDTSPATKLNVSFIFCRDNLILYLIGTICGPFLSLSYIHTYTSLVLSGCRRHDESTKNGGNPE